MAFGDVTIQDVANALGAQTNDGGNTYVVFGGAIPTVAMQKQLDIAKDWLTDLLPSEAKTDQTALANDVITSIAAYRTLLITTGQMLVRGFGYSLGKLNIDKRHFPQFMEQTIKRYHEDALSLLRQLLEMGKTVDQSDLEFVNPILDSGTGKSLVGFDTQWKSG